jgi:hypothetical protein
MRTHFTHLPEADLVVEKFHGRLGVHDILEVFDAEIRAGIRKPGLRALADYREATVEASAVQLHELAQWVVDHAEFMREARWAVLVQRREVARISKRVADVMLPRIGAESRVFEDPHEACAWLGVDYVDPREVGHAGA